MLFDTRTGGAQTLNHRIGYKRKPARTQNMARSLGRKMDGNLPLVRTGAVLKRHNRNTADAVGVPDGRTRNLKMNNGRAAAKRKQNKKQANSRQCAHGRRPLLKKRRLTNTITGPKVEINVL